MSTRSTATIWEVQCVRRIAIQSYIITVPLSLEYVDAGTDILQYWKNHSTWLPHNSHESNGVYIDQKYLHNEEEGLLCFRQNVSPYNVDKTLVYKCW